VPKIYSALRNSQATRSSKSSATPLSIPILGLGHIVSFKNTKSIAFNKRTRRPFIMTNPRKKKAMDSYTRAIERAISSAYQMAVAGMETAPSLQSWTASSLPLDDSLEWIPQSDGYRTERVKAGEEGIIIVLERI
jgi:hypothetical protein